MTSINYVEVFDEKGNWTRLDEEISPKYPKMRDQSNTNIKMCQLPSRINPNMMVDAVFEMKTHTFIKDSDDFSLDPRQYRTTIDQSSLIQPFRYKDRRTLMYHPSSPDIQNDRKNIFFFKETAFDACSEAVRSWPADNDHCSRCRKIFDWSHWRHQCVNCGEQYCSNCLTEDEDRTNFTKSNNNPENQGIVLTTETKKYWLEKGDDNLCKDCFYFWSNNWKTMDAQYEDFKRNVMYLSTHLFAGTTFDSTNLIIPFNSPGKNHLKLTETNKKLRSLMRFENPYVREILPGLVIYAKFYHHLHHQQMLHYLITVNPIFNAEVSQFHKHILQKTNLNDKNSKENFLLAHRQFIMATADEMAVLLRGETYSSKLPFFEDYDAARKYLLQQRETMTVRFSYKPQTLFRMFCLFQNNCCIPDLGQSLYLMKSIAAICNFERPILIPRSNNINNNNNSSNNITSEADEDSPEALRKYKSTSGQHQELAAFAQECSWLMNNSSGSIFHINKLSSVVGWLLDHRIQITKTQNPSLHFVTLRMIATFTERCECSPDPVEFKRFFASVNEGAAHTIASFTEDANKTAQENEETLFRMITVLAFNCSAAIKTVIESSGRNNADHPLRVRYYLQASDRAVGVDSALHHAIRWLLDHRHLFGEDSLKGPIKSTFSHFTIGEAFSQAATAAGRYTFSTAEDPATVGEKKVRRKRSPWPMLNLLEDCFYDPELRKVAFEDPSNSTTKIASTPDIVLDLNLCIRKLEAKLSEISREISVFDYASPEVQRAQPGTYWQNDLVNVYDDSSEAATAISAVFLYSLDAIPFYKLLNAFLRDHTSFTEKGTVANLLEPLHVSLQGFLTKMPGRPRILYRGQSYRVVENLDESAPPFRLESFTSTSINFSIAYQAFLKGNRSGSFLIYVSMNAVDISPFSAFPDEGEVILPHGALYETIHRVPLSHLAIMNQRFDVACMAEPASANSGVSPQVRLQMNFEAMTAVSTAYKEIQNYFMSPMLTQEATGKRVTLLDTINEILLPPEQKHGDTKNYLCISACAGSGKSTLSIFLNSYVNEHSLQGYHSLLISLPAIGKDLFSDHALQKHVQRRLRFTDKDMELLKTQKLLLILDSLDEVSLSSWPRDRGIGRGMKPQDWPHLRVIITCRGEHLQLHNLNMYALSVGRGHTYGIEPFDREGVKCLMELWIPPPPELTGDDESKPEKVQAYRRAIKEAKKCREDAFVEYSQHPASFQTPFMLYLLAHSHHAKLRSNNDSGGGQKGNNYDDQDDDEFDRLNSDDQQQQLTPPPPTRTAVDIDDPDAVFISSPNRLGGAGSSALATNGQVSSQRSKFQSERAALRKKAMMNSNNTTTASRLHTDPTAAAESIIVANAAPSSRIHNPQLLDPEKYLGVTFANVSGIVGIYELGTKALIVQNILHLYHDPNPAAVRRLVNDVFEWSQLLAVMMLSENDSWKGTIDDFPRIFMEEYQTWFTQDPTTMVLLAPLRISGYSALSLFEFRHKSLHEFLVAYASANCTSTRILSYVRKIDFRAHPNIQMFHSMLVKNTDLVQTADLSDAVRSSKLKHFLTCVSSMKASRVCIEDITIDDDNGNNTDVQAAESSSSSTFDCSKVGDLSCITHLELNCQSHFAKAILDQCTKLETLIFSDPLSNDETLIRAIERNAKTLKSIDLAGTSVTDLTLLEIIDHVERFESLNFSSCSFSRQTLDKLSQCKEKLQHLRYLNLSNDIDSVLSDEILNRFILASSNIQSLNIASVPNLGDASVYNTISANLPDLIALDASESRISDDSFKLILSSLTQLTRLSVANCRHLGRHHGMKLKKVACRHLMKLDVMNTKIGDAALESIITSLQDLHVLHASKEVTDKTIAVVAEYAPLLREIFISHSFGAITDVSIEKIAHFCPLLRSISLRDSRAVTDKSIRAISQLCQNLREVRISETRDITDNGLMELATCCKDLRVLDISGTLGFISDRTILTVAKECPRLEVLNVNGTAGAVTDKSITEIARNCPKLVELDVGLTKGRISDEAIEAIALNCRGLRRLVVFSTQGQVTDKSLQILVKNVPQLREFNIAYTYGKVSSETLIQVANHCPNLEELNIASTNHSIQDHALIEIAKKCRRLKSLNVSYCMQDISDRSMIPIAQSCQKLRQVTISGCEGITEETVKVLKKNCRQIKIVQ